MIELASELPGGATIIIPRTLTMMVGVVEARVRRFSSIESGLCRAATVAQRPNPFCKGSNTPLHGQSKK